MEDGNHDLCSQTSVMMMSSSSINFQRDPSAVYISSQTEAQLVQWMHVINTSDSPLILQALRSLRDKLLGHQALRASLVLKYHLVEQLAPFLSMAPAIVLSSDHQQQQQQPSNLALEIVREVVVIMGSISYGSMEEVNVLCQSNVPALLLDLVCRCVNGSLAGFAVRAFSSTSLSRSNSNSRTPMNLASVQSAVDISSQSFTSVSEMDPIVRELCQHALRALRTVHRHPIDHRAQIFSPNNLPILLHLLLVSQSVEKISTTGNNSTTAIHHDAALIREYCAVLIANCCDSRDKQDTLAASQAIQTAVHMLTSRHVSQKSLEAALDLLAAAIRDHRENCHLLFNLNAPRFLFSLIEEKSVNMSVEIHLFASLCLAHLVRNVSQISSDRRLVQLLLPALDNLLAASGRSVRTRAAQILALLVSESHDLQIQCCNSQRRIIPSLVSMVRQVSFLDQSKTINSSSGANSEGISTNPPSQSMLMTADSVESALLALSAISSFKEECRKAVIDQQVLGSIIEAMDISMFAGVRSAACQLTRALSRSVKNLRTSLVDAGVARPLLKLLSDPSVAVQTAAAAALCNLVLDFSPMKEVVLKEGGVQRLVEIVSASNATAIESNTMRQHNTRSRSISSASSAASQFNGNELVASPPDLRFNALWALKNLVYLADTEIKLAALDLITCPVLEALTMDDEVLIQEQAMNLLRNLVCEREQDISAVLDRFGCDRLIALVERKLNSSSADVVIHSCYVIANACTAQSAAPKQAVIDNARLLARLGELLLASGSNHQSALNVQLAALWCIINLTWTDDTGSMARIQVLRNAGFEEKLEQMMSMEPTGDLRDRLQTALNNFSALDPNVSSVSRRSSPMHSQQRQQSPSNAQGRMH